MIKISVKIFRMTLNQRGQAAIFIALMFNVLFLFFAMAINVALVVHDKINLQNSADLAAYYVAARQAEMLNVIAHQNYQIRQSWKLLTWRYRVLGTMGLYVDDPNPVWQDQYDESVYAQAVRPSLCITYKPTWAEVPENENLCNRPNLRIPPLPEVKVIAGFLGINHGIAALSRQLRAQFDFQCSRKGAYNWWYSMSILHAFRLDQHNRRLVIRGIANNISANSKEGDFLDLNGSSVKLGAQKTFVKNLTFANRQAFDSGRGEFTVLNSLEGISPDEWLPEIAIAPTMIYTDVDNEAGCNASPQPVSNLPQRPAGREYLRANYPNGLQAADLEPWREASVLQDKEFQYTIGVEKNPWYMPYVGIKVKTVPRQIFFPFGGGIEMTARTFAKPFGGRIGPWYNSKWERENKQSDGAKVDTLMAPRIGGLDDQDPTRLPNYSRFPGDQYGLQTRLAINSLNGLKGLVGAFENYKNIKEDMGPGKPNDVLAWDGVENKAPDIRSFELAAIAPDLFDITYYSIEPNFTSNYWEKIKAANPDNFGIPFNVPFRPDLGYHEQTIPVFSVQDQMKEAKDKNRQRFEAYYFVRDKTHLLTGWVPGKGTYNYEVQASMQYFGQCALPDDALKFKNPGSCVAEGGRTGYSVKMISRDALLSSQHKIGGEAPAGAIKNPPPTTGGW